MARYTYCSECKHCKYEENGAPEYPNCHFWCDLKGYEEVLSRAETEPHLKQVIDSNVQYYFFEETYCYFSNEDDYYNSFPYSEETDDHREATDPERYRRPCLLFRYIGYDEDYDGFEQK